MGGINTLSGLNNVSIDTRPGIAPTAPNANNPVQQPQGNNILQDDVQPAGVDVANVVKQLDVLLLGAANKSVAASAETKLKAIEDALIDSNVIDAEEYSKLENLAKDATEKLKALDNFSGREIAKALMEKSGDLVWSKGFFGGMKPVTLAVKAAVEAQEALSEALGKLNESLATNDHVDADLQDAFTELQFQCDRRATEIYSVVVRMHDLALRDAVNRIGADPQAEAFLNAKFKELMPREAVMMHGTAEAFKTMKKSFAGQMDPIVKMLAAFATDGAKTLSVEEVSTLDANMATLKNVLENVRKNGLEITHPVTKKEDDIIQIDDKKDVEYTVTRTEVDKTLLDEMEKILADVEEQVNGAKDESVRRARAEFPREVRNALDFDRLPNGSDLMRSGGDHNHVLTSFKSATNRLVKLLEDFASGSKQMADFDREFALCIARFPSAQAVSTAMQEVRFPAATANSFLKSINGFGIIAAQFKEMMAVGERLRGNAADSAVVAEDVRRIMLGETRLSAYVEAKSRGFERKDVNGETDETNIRSTQKLGSGLAGTTYLVTTHSGEEFVFKPELDGRLGLNRLAIGTGNAYKKEQTAANLILATQDTAKAFGCEDIIVKSSVGVYEGQFGVFMEKAKGFTGEMFLQRNTDGNGGIAATNLKTLIPNAAEREVIKGKIAKKLNQLMWLDLITGQGDRHWANYFICIDPESHEVTLKAIDNDASFNEYRIGMQKYVLSGEKAELFQEKLENICARLHSNVWQDELIERINQDPGIEVDEDTETITVDLSKAMSPELDMAINGVLGTKSTALPEEIDKDFYDNLIAMETNPDKRREFLDSIAPRISHEALVATEKRLDDAIAYAKKLANQDPPKVYGDNEWQNPDNLAAMTQMKSELTINRTNGTSKTFKMNNPDVKEYLETSTPSFYTRESFDRLFD